MRLSRLPCRGAGYGVVVGIGLFFSAFMLGLTFMQVSWPPTNQIGLDVDDDRINRPDIRIFHQRTPKVRITVEAPRRPSNSLARVQLSVPFHQERSHGFWNCLGVDVGRYAPPTLIVSNLDFQMGGDIPPV